MLKTYRIIPLVFILFLFGFTFVTVSPVLAVSDDEFRALQDRVIALEAKTYDLVLPDKDPFTYYPSGDIRQSRDKKFHCEGFPQIREEPDRPEGYASAKCKQAFDRRKGRTGNPAPQPKEFFCADFPEARNYQECMKKKGRR